METTFQYIVLLFEKPFKSYYVVWKQHTPKKNHFPFSEFKSYYVVWKLIHMTEIKKIAQGLNRTM